MRETVPLTRAGVIEGARLVLPMVPGTVVFAAAFGTVASQKGLSVLEATLMSALVYAGASQFVGIGAWGTSTGWALVLGAGVLAFIVNARLILQGASLQPWLVGLRPATKWSMLATLTDANWIVAERYRATGGDDRGVFLGAGLTLWLFWMLGTLPGALAGNLISDPKRLAMDLVLPIYFASYAVPLWRGWRDGLIWGLAGAVALATTWAGYGHGAIVAGALAGALLGSVMPEFPAKSQR